MSSPDLEPLVVPALLALVDAPVRGEDEERLLLRLATATTRLPGVDAASCHLTDSHGRPQQLAASDDAALQLERYQSELLEGPCVDSLRSRKPLPNIALNHPHSRVRWPRFAPRAVEVGFTAVTALPIRYEDRALGALNLYHQHNALDPAQESAGTFLATAAAIGLNHGVLLRQLRERERQLQGALTSRVLIEQAKGILAERMGCTVDKAFDLLRRHSRSHQAKLTDVAKRIVDDPDAADFLLPPPS